MKPLKWRKEKKEIESKEKERKKKIRTCLYFKNKNFHECKHKVL